MKQKEKAVIEIFQNISVNNAFQTNLPEEDFLNVILNLHNGTYRPYKKPNDKLRSINQKKAALLL